MPQSQVASTTAVSVDRASVSFVTDDGTIDAFADVSIEIEAGCFVTIIGPSGCGKSTLLRSVADLVPVSSGRIDVFGSAPCKARLERDFAFVFQEAALLPWLTALENVKLPLEVGLAEARVANFAEPAELLELVGLGDRKDALPHELSGGMRQRVAIARALVCNPRVLLMDEPFGALDEITRDRLNNELLAIWRNTGTTILFVTHSITEAAYLGQRVMVMRGATPGRVAECFDIDLPNERNSDLLDELEFVKITKHLRGLLRSGTAT